MTFGEVSANAPSSIWKSRVLSPSSPLSHGSLLDAAWPSRSPVASSTRKRLFTLLRVTGTETGDLYRTVLLEMVLPLVAATLVAASVGLALATPIARTLAPARHAVVAPHAGYYLVLGTGLLVSTLIVTACMPILGQITATEKHPGRVEPHGVWPQPGRYFVSHTGVLR